MLGLQARFSEATLKSEILDLSLVQHDMYPNFFLKNHSTLAATKDSLYSRILLSLPVKAKWNPFTIPSQKNLVLRG